MTCGCPDPVIQTLRAVVQTELNRVRQILRLSGFFETLSDEALGEAGVDIDAAVNVIPSPISFDVGEIASYLTCPLTPLALACIILNDDDGGGFGNQSPTSQVSRLKALYRRFIDDARNAYEQLLDDAPSASTIRIARRYERNLSRVGLTAASFAKAVTVTATVLDVCGEEEYTAGPYQDFANVAQGFDFVGGIPNSISGNAAALVSKLTAGETKFKALRASLA